MRTSDAKVIWQVAATYVGTVVGAGFASGQEVLQFFTRYGEGAVWAIALSTALFYVFGLYTMRLGRRRSLSTFGDVSIAILGRPLSIVVRAALLLLLFGVTVAMLAGSGALVQEQFSVPFSIGALIAVMATALTLFSGLRGVISANTWIVPLLIGFVVFAFAFSLTNYPAHMQFFIIVPAPLSPWKLALSALFYTGFNVGLSLTVLIPLGQVPHSERFLWQGALLGAIILGLLLFLMHVVMANQFDLLSVAQVPMGQLAKSFPTVMRYGFILAVFAEIFSTLIANVYGIATELSGSRRQQYFMYVVLVLTLTFLFCQIGFTQIVTIFYPIFGIVGLAILVLLMIKPLWR